MSGNTIGKLFSVTSFGESHGPALGCIVDGCPPGLELSEDDLQHDLDRRKPGQSRHTTQRREEDRVRILSGVFEGRTTGTPIGLLIENTDQRSRDYSEIMDRFRPGHADYTYQQKYGVRDYRGGGRASARETAMRVAAGAVAKKYLHACCGMQIRGYLAQLGPIAAQAFDWEEVEKNPFFCPDAGKVAEMEAYMDGIRKAGEIKGTNGNAYYARIEGKHAILDGFMGTNWLPGAEYRLPVAPVESPENVSTPLSTISSIEPGVKVLTRCLPSTL